MTAREPGRQGPPSDPNRDGCGPAALLLLGVLVALVLLLVGCREASTSVSPGAYCSPAGATADGTPMECTARPGDDRARWRQP